MANFDARRTMMVDTQVRPSDVTKFPIIDAMLSVPREDFVPTSLREAAYVGENLMLPGGRTMLEPRTLAKMLDALDVQPADVMLDVGCGLGYSTAVAARIVSFVVGLEDDADRAAEAQSNLSDAGIDNAAVMTGPLAEGVAKSGPYDAIIVHGAVEVVPDALTDQLRPGGRIAALFSEGALGTVRIGLKSDGGVTWRYAFNAGAPTLAGFTRDRTFAL
ncbi:protein-L-isoaspartate(D-aspartate) O-methyltransferase [Loktanella atrilutea]|uniref:Protein-L-isoaspartate O-methyltransferase n=2 Tax=Loktanella atrilutea TaxID=366533 RepID=A0A1M4SS51_LOKAT|nr:protein-L-isoaspartate O-methyltransferase [Loktanella atrilutea]SHE35008.1 protein-L-isoaspartate(D-aspartate) O-methyltransferase [Loktanella atrilutea]